MALTKETVIDKIEIDEYNNISVRRATYILEDGVRIAGPMYQRRAYAIDDETISTEDGRVVAVSDSIKDIAQRR